MALLAISANGVAALGATAGLVSAVAAPLAAWLVAKRTTDTTRRLAREERSVEAYDEAMRLAYQATDVIIATVAIMEGKASGAVTRYDPGDTSAIAARLEVRGSPEAAQALESLAKAAMAFFAVRDEIVAAGGPVPESKRRELYDARDAVIDERRRLGALIRFDFRR